MILEALSPGANTSRIARAYGIHRNTVHEYINRAVRDAEGSGGRPRRRLPSGARSSR
jgi:transposase-like protein